MLAFYFRREMWKYIVNFVSCIFILSMILEAGSSALCSPVYGAEPCPFVPAPPGRTPPCARPGDTFCENLEHYPMQHIRYLIDKWGYDYATLFSDETRDEYSTYFTQPDYHYGGYPNSIHPNSNPSSGANGYPYPEPIYIPKPPAGAAQYPQPPNNKYIPPPQQQVASNGGRANYTDGFQGYPDRRPARYPGYLQGNGLNHGYRGHHHGYFVPSQGTGGGYNGYHGPQLSYYDPNSWWRYSRDNKNLLSRSKRSSKTKKTQKTQKSKTKKVEAPPENKNSTSPLHREKRQSVLGGAQQLCPTRSQYIMPRAALNNKGNWMYVVNLQEQDNRYTQLVKSESCVSQTCSGLCSVPTGYTARCEQRYVQKRLVALEGAGTNLYTDVFWFPSCCVCTFTSG